ncbi:hypothetical protein GCM10009416_29320 [Craurococcus roseus]|uniref:Uncharacterized protein n=1 Tax=Craurococcus roseus TaxID=77585 RepID=A0ABP3QDL6_9PROT
MPEHDARQRFDLDVPEGGPLLLGEVAHLFLGEADVLDVTGRELREARADLRVGQPVIGAVPFVETDRQLAHGVVAAVGDVGQYAFDRRPHLRVVFGRGARVTTPLQITRHASLPA